MRIIILCIIILSSCHFHSSQDQYVKSQFINRKTFICCRFIDTLINKKQIKIGFDTSGAIGIKINKDSMLLEKMYLPKWLSKERTIKYQLNAFVRNHRLNVTNSPPVLFLNDSMFCFFLFDSFGGFTPIFFIENKGIKLWNKNYPFLTDKLQEDVYGSLLYDERSKSFIVPQTWASEESDDQGVIFCQITLGKSTFYVNKEVLIYSKDMPLLYYKNDEEAHVYYEYVFKKLLDK